MSKLSRYRRSLLTLQFLMIVSGCEGDFFNGQEPLTTESNNICATQDAVRGIIVARQNNQLTLSDTSIIGQTGELNFDNEITVLIADTTLVTKNRQLPGEVTIDNLSIGQSVTIIGTINQLNGQYSMDATDHTLSHEQLALNMALQPTQGQCTERFDFNGTGVDENIDPLANNYEALIEDLLITNIEAASPIKARGFVNSLGRVPADFNALTMINFADAGSHMVVDWPTGEKILAFSDITNQTLTINTEAEGGDAIYQLIQGSTRTDLTSFNSAVVIKPLTSRGVYTIKTESGIINFSNFSYFTSTLQQKLNEGKSIDLMHSIGGFSREMTTLSALKIAIKLN